ncbi:MAG: peptide-N-glycosidase F-related protein [Myxococcota bacterium]|nr:peptide-N-glycosidase F-related protein [Myxococcota bacterium]
MLLSVLSLLLACKDKAEPTEPVDSAEPDTAAPTVCDDGVAIRPFADAEESEALYAVAADFTVETTEGTWTLSEAWTGCGPILLLQDTPRQATGWPTPLWERDHDDFFATLPSNTTVLFMSTDSSSSDRDEILADMQVLVEEELADAFSEAEQEAWKAQIHYVTDRASEIEGWVGPVMISPGWGIGIDRFQRIRYVGSYADPTRYLSSEGWFEPNLGMAANEAVFYNFEAAREEELEALDADILPVLEQEYCAGNAYVDVELPDAETMAGYDSMTIDLYMGCVGEGEYGDCPAWDYMAYLYVCDMPDADNADADTTCQPAVAEVLGSCAADGKIDDKAATCREAKDCEDKSKTAWTCEGYEESIAADTLPGTCTDPLGDAADAVQTCRADGSGYDDLACACDTEIGRWITTYHREGRWVYDNSAMLPYLARGGTRTFRFNTTGPYELDMDFHLSSQGKDARPDEIEYLFSGGTLNVDYNANHPDVTLDIPADAVKVELATVISQHGADGNNCGEFCDVSHHFMMNGDEANEIVRSFPEASSAYDCMEKVAVGTVPNQYGTWWYGRAGWCPGKDVETVVFDITDQVTPGEENAFSYKALYQGADYTGSATMRLRSWVVISR